MWPEPITRRMTFELRDAAGTAELTYRRNDDPAHWGYDLLDVDFDYGVAHGFPVIEGRVSFPRRGYAGILGWVQAVDYVVRKDDGGTESVVVAPDVAPQSRDADQPFLSVGIEPQLFDAPAFTERNVDWNARAFLTYSPDCLMTPVVEPLCGCFWGYVIEDGEVRPKDLRPATIEDWQIARAQLQERRPRWTFGGEQWQPRDFAAGDA
jgi:hypothetical protein